MNYGCRRERDGRRQLSLGGLDDAKGQHGSQQREDSAKGEHLTESFEHMACHAAIPGQKSGQMVESGGAVRQAV